MQLRWAKEAVRDSVARGSKNQQADCVHGLALKLQHMVASLEQYVMFVVATAWSELEGVRILDSRRSRQAVKRCQASRAVMKLQY